MSRFTLVLAVVATALCASSFAISFDCRRDGQSCNAALCNYVTGACACVGGRTGYNCEIQNNAVSPQADCNTCRNGGSCYRNGGMPDPKCFCAEEFTGTNCELRRVRIRTCEHDQIEAVIDPHGAFGGEMAFMYKLGGNNGEYQYVDSSTGSISCDPTDRLKVTVFEQNGKIGTKDDTACINRIDDFPSAGWLTAEFAVSVQYNKEIWGVLDNSYLFRCSYSKQGNKTIGTAVDLLPPTLLPVTEQTLVVPINFYIAAAGDVPISGTQIKGDNRFLTVAFNSRGVFKDFAVKECTAYSNEGDFTQGSKLAIVVDKCFDRGAISYFKRMIKTTTDPAKQLIQMDFTIFKFKNGDRVVFNCIISLCRTVNDPACLPKSCNGADQFGRRRRDVPGELSSEERTFKQTITVLDKSP